MNFSIIARQSSASAVKANREHCARNEKRIEEIRAKLRKRNSSRRGVADAAVSAQGTEASRLIIFHLHLLPNFYAIAQASSINKECLSASGLSEKRGTVFY